MSKIIKRMIIAAMVTLSGCANQLISGNSNFGCSGIPNGKPCISTEDAYEDSNRSLSKSAWRDDSKGTGKPTKAVKVVANIEQTKNIMLPESDDPKPIRTPANVMRIWVAPWEDKHGDLHMSSLVYTEIKARRWIVGEAVEGGVGGRGVWPLLTTHTTRKGKK